MNLEKIRKVVRRLKSESKTPRYSKEIKEAILFHHSEGVGLQELSGKAGLSRATVSNWVRESRASVKVTSWPKKSQNSFKLLLPDGSQVEGLSLEDIIRLREYDVVSKKGA